MSNLRIALARPSDAGLVHHIMTTAYQQYRGRIAPPLGALYTTPADIAAAIRSRRQGYILAYIDDRAVGSLRYQTRRVRGKRCVVLSRLAVLPEFRGEGIGSELMTWAEERCRQVGIAELRGDVRAALPHLVEFYKSLGFVPIGRRSQPGYRNYLVVIAKPLDL